MVEINGDSLDYSNDLCLLGDVNFILIEEAIDLI
jgi:hypothetical protein